MSGQLEFAVLIEDALVSALSVDLEKFEGLRIASTTPVTPEQLERYRIKSDQLGLIEVVVAGSLLIAAGVVEHFIVQDQVAAHVVIDATQSPPTIRTVMTLGSTDGHIRMANEAFCKMYGYSEEELVGKSFWELSHPEDLEESRERQRQLVAGEVDLIQAEKRYLWRPFLGQKSVGVSLQCH